MRAAPSWFPALKYHGNPLFSSGILMRRNLTMPEFTNPYDAVIADLEAKRAEIDSALQLMKRLREGVGSTTISATALPSTNGNSPDLSVIPSDAFFNMTIGDAAVKFLSTWASRKPQGTRTIVDALDQGGLKGKKYQTVYGVLNGRRGRQGDVVNIHGDWGLAEWYGSAKKKIKISVPTSSLSGPAVGSEWPEEPEPEPKA